MGFPDYDFTGPKNSYVSAPEVLDFIQNYAQKFKVVERIKFRHEIVRIRPVGMTSRWEIMVRDLGNDSIGIQQFDAVMCCNGHFSCPHIPEIPGRNLYGGKVLHTHSYRTADTFKGKYSMSTRCIHRIATVICSQAKRY